MHTAGASDRLISRRLGVGFSAVRSARRRLGMSPNDGRADPEYRRHLADAVRAVHAANGNRGPAKARAVQADMRAGLAIRYGLPADLKPVQVLIVLALSSGPLTAGRLGDACDRRPANVKDYDRFNHSYVPGKNYLADLRRRGLVVSIRSGPQADAVYSITPLCMELMTGGRHDDARAGGDDFGGGKTGAGGAGGSEAAARPVGR